VNLYFRFNVYTLNVLYDIDFDIAIQWPYCFDYAKPRRIRETKNTSIDKRSKSAFVRCSSC